MLEENFEKQRETRERQVEVYKRKKKFRLWLVGNPEELGYMQDDKANELWYPAVNLIAYMIYASEPDKEIFTGTYAKWIGDTLYFAEAFPMGVHYTKAYQEFDRLLDSASTVVSGDPLSEIREKHIYITDFAIPKNHDFFDKIVKVYADILEKRNQRNRKVQSHLRSIKQILNLQTEILNL